MFVCVSVSVLCKGAYVRINPCIEQACVLPGYTASSSVMARPYERSASCLRQVQGLNPEPKA